MTGEPRQARSATMALLYVTIGALLVVWTIIYYIWLNRNGGTDNAYLLNAGLFASGVVLIVIGLAVGRIGRNARQAEVSSAAPVAVVTAPGAPAAEPAPVALINPPPPLTTAPGSVPVEVRR